MAASKITSNIMSCCFSSYFYIENHLLNLFISLSQKLLPDNPKKQITWQIKHIFLKRL